MNKAAECWGMVHDELLTKLCFHIVTPIYGEDCSIILQNMSPEIEDINEIREACKLSPAKFDAALSSLVHKKIISTDPLNLNLSIIFNYLLNPHFIQFAESYSIIPQDKHSISIITKKVLDEPTLKQHKLVLSITTKHQSIDQNTVARIIDHLLAKNVFITNQNNAISFNYSFFYAVQREKALENLVELNDRRVLEVVRSLFSPELYLGCLVDKDQQEIDLDVAIPTISTQTGLSFNEIMKIFDILKTPEYSILNIDNTLTPSEALKSYKMKRIAQLLSEIGYPLARRVINALLRKQCLEGSALCEMLLMSSEFGSELLERLKYLGVLMNEQLQDAPHTTLKRQYTLWKLSIDSSINNSSSYLLGVLAKLYYDLQKEQEQFMAASESGSSIGDQSRKFDEKTEVLQNTIFAVTRRYIEIHEL